MSLEKFLGHKRPSLIVAAVSLALTAIPLAGFAQNTLPATQQPKIDAIVRQVLTSSGVPSASVGIVADGKIAYLKAYGMAKLNPPVDATPQMRYSIGSVSKQFTVAAIQMLQQQGKLTLNDTVSKWLPDLTRANQVTLREILSHTSGYQDYYAEDYSLPPMKNPTTPDAILDNWGKKPLDFDPGTEWQYSNTNYVIAGKIVQMVSGMPLMEFLQRNIFTPLHMTRVMNSDRHPLEATDPDGYIRYALGPLHIAPRDGTGWVFAGGELAMPVRDLLLWDISLMNETLLQPSSYREMLTSVKLKNGQDTHYGLGEEIATRDGHLIVSHSGEVSGFTSENVVLPRDKVAIAVLTNEEATDASGIIARKIASLLLDLPPNESKRSEEQARQIFIGLQHGKIDRSLFTANCNAYFDTQALGDFESSLRPLGAPIEFRQTEKELRGGMVFRAYDVVFPTADLEVTTYQMPNGKIEQFIVTTAE